MRTQKSAPATKQKKRTLGNRKQRNSQSNDDFVRGSVWLGRIFQAVRSQKYDSCLALAKDVTKSSFPLSQAILYAYEAGQRRVAPEAFELLAQLVGCDPIPLLLATAVVHVRDRELQTKLMRLVEGMLAHPTHGKLEDTPQILTEAQLEDKWIFTDLEFDIVRKYPWILEIVIALQMVYPSAIKLSDLGLDSRAEIQKFLERYLETFIQNRRIFLERDSLRLAKPDFHFPRTAKWEQVRAGLMRSTLDDLLQSVTAAITAERGGYAGVWSGYVNEFEFQEILMLLSSIESKLTTKPPLEFEPNRPKRVSFVGVFGERRQNLTELIKREKSK